MTKIEVFMLCNVVCIWLCLVWLGYKCTKPNITEHDKHLNKNTDVEKVVDDFEQSAAYVDIMLAQDRKTAVRDDQVGPNAVVHRPRQIGPKVNGPKYFGR